MMHKPVLHLKTSGLNQAGASPDMIRKTRQQETASWSREFTVKSHFQD